MKYLFLLAVLAISCKSAQTDDARTTDETTEQVTKINEEYPRLLERMVNGPIDSKQLVLLYEPYDLEDVYALINQTRKPGLKLPQVNWETENVLLAALGTQNSGGHSIELKSDKKGHYTAIHTPPQGAATMALTAPLYLWAVPKGSQVDWSLVN